jgi:hypothetical protein
MWLCNSSRRDCSQRIGAITGVLISSKLARLCTDSRILGMIRRHIIRPQMLSIPFTMKQRRAGDTRASIDNRSPETSRDQRPGNQRNCSTDWNSSMTPHEKALVTVLLERLKKTDSPDKDPEAETLIRQNTAEQPDAAYHLVQTVLIQDLSLHVAQSRITELEKSLAEATTASFLPRSFLGGLSTPKEQALKAAAPPT